MKPFSEYMSKKIRSARGSTPEIQGIICDAQGMMAMLYEAVMQELVDQEGEVDTIKIDPMAFHITQILEAEDRAYGQTVLFEAQTNYSEKHKFRFWYSDDPGNREEPPDFDAELTCED